MQNFFIIYNKTQNQKKLALSAFKMIAIIVALAGVAFVFTSSSLIHDDHASGAKPNKNDIKKNIDKAMKKLKEKFSDNDDNEKREEKRDEDDDEKEEEVEKTNYDYGFADEGDNKLKDFNFVAAGDYGCSSNAKNTINSMEDKKPELVLPLGDLSVDKTATCWLDLVSPFDDKLQITFGYSEVKDGESKLNQYKDVFGLDKLYYSFDYRNTHFIVMSTLSDFAVTSDQYKFIEKDLQQASANENIDWIVVTNYGPFYTSPSAHPAKNDIRNIYHPLFDKYGVDLVLQGHNHNYQRTYPVIFNPSKASEPIVTNQFTTGYQGSKDGVIYAIVGTAGEGFHPLQGRQTYVATQFEGMFGFLNIDITNGNPYTKLTGTFYDNKDGKVGDQFTIEKEIKNNDPQNVLVQYQQSN
ncbi:MAG TPA: metallophosphoesterase [Nitrososphaeraceae archaeon]|nr:metallophosphoesterase [Nitrososphaeraceae archaeon]